MMSLTPTGQSQFYRLNTKQTASDHLTANEASNRLQHLTTLTPIVMLYLALAFYQIDNQSLWTDEVISIRRTSEPIWARIYSQSPMYFILLGLWSKLVGTSEFALRSFSTLLGVAAVCVTYAIGYKLFNRKTAVFAAILLATSPYFIWYSQEVRYITLLLLTSLLMTYAFQRAIASGHGRWWLSYGVTSLLALFSFLTVVFVLVAHGLYLLSFACHRPILRKWMACQLVIILVFASWLGVRSGRKIITALTKPPTIVSVEQKRSPEILQIFDLLGAIPYTFYAFSVGFSLGPSVEDLHVSRSSESLLNHAPTLVPVGIFFGTLFVLGLTKLSQNKDSGLFVVLWLGVPIVATFLVATVTTYHVYNTRYVAMALPAYALIVATGIVALRRLSIQIALLVSVVCINGLSLSNYYFDARYARADSRSAAEYLERSVRPGDIILALGHPRALQYYYKQGVPIETIDARGHKGAVVPQKLRELVKDYNHLWLVEIRPWQRDPKGKVKTTLDNLARRAEHKGFPGVDVYLYDLLAR